METVRFSYGKRKKKVACNRSWTIQSYIDSYLLSKFIGEIQNSFLQYSKTIGLRIYSSVKIIQTDDKIVYILFKRAVQHIL